MKIDKNTKIALLSSEGVTGKVITLNLFLIMYSLNYLNSGLQRKS